MYNPFETFDRRLSVVENLLLEIINNPPEDKKPENLTVKETAEILKVSTQTVHSYIRKGYLPAEKVGRIFLIKRLDLQNSLKDVKSFKYKRD